MSKILLFDKFKQRLYSVTNRETASLINKFYHHQVLHVKKEHPETITSFEQFQKMMVDEAKENIEASRKSIIENNRLYEVVLNKKDNSFFTLFYVRDNDFKELTPNLINDFVSYLRMKGKISIDKSNFLDKYYIAAINVVALEGEKHPEDEETIDWRFGNKGAIYYRIYSDRLQLD